ncbi:MAG: ATP-binding protein [Flavobacteriales bacterium]
MQFKDISGYDEVKLLLRDSVNQSRIAHAQLFAGPEGNAGLSLALAYISYLFCSNKTQEDSCGQCASCQKIKSLSHPDLHFSYPIMLSKTDKVAISTDAIMQWREALKENAYMAINQWYKYFGSDNKQGIIANEEAGDIFRKLSLKSYEGGYKVLLMWLPEMMNAAAANKLLKILEEPPDKTLFLLVSAHPEELLPTITSRTQLVRIRRFNDEEIITELQKRGVDGATSVELATLSDGSMAKAMALYNDNAEAQHFFDLFVRWMRICFKRDVSDSLNWVEELAKHGRETQKAFLVYGLEMLRKSMAAKLTQGEMLKAAPSQLEFLKNFAPHISLSNLPNITKFLNDAHYHLERNANPKILFMDLTLKMFATFKK